MSALGHALHVAKVQGWRVFPLHGKVPCKDTHGFKDASADSAIINKLFASYPDATGYGIATGGTLLVVDFDSKNGGMESKAVVEAKHGPFPVSVAVFTGGDGLHLYYRTNNPGKNTQGRIARGIDTRGNGGYVVGPGSIHPSGKPYTWSARPDDLAIAEAPQWLLGLLVAETETTEAIALPCSAISACSAVSVTLSVEDVIARTLPRHPGERNARILDLARGLRFNAGMAESSPLERRAIVRRWFDAALPVIRTKDFTESWSDFIHAWPLARVPLGQDVLSAAWTQSQNNPPPAAVADYDNEAVRRLICLCAALARQTNAARFFLSSRAAAARLDVSSMQVSRWLRMLITDKVLEVTQAGNERRATRYRWIAVDRANRDILTRS